MAGTWAQRLEELERRVGEDVLQGQFIVNQPYAAYQHVHEELRHPRGGGPHFVTAPLLENHRDYLQHVADGVLDGDAVQHMADAMEDMSDELLVRAPVLHTPLRNSGHPVVRDNGVVMYDRPPIAPRVTP